MPIVASGRVALGGVLQGEWDFQRAEEHPGVHSGPFARVWARPGSQVVASIGNDGVPGALESVP